jgi:NAD(P)-dependent dehydrogenase (short-subunit alcohol dehydrogenase family)
MIEPMNNVIELGTLNGKAAVVTGGSSAIGAAISADLALAGASVFVGYNTNLTAAIEVCEAITAAGGYAEPTLWRTTSLVEWDLHGDIDILVNCAGVTAGRSVRNMTDADWQHVLDVNLTGAMKATRAVLPGMLERGYGRVVNITSVVGIDGRLGPSSYAASKAGLIGFTKACALEVASKGVTVNAVAPGFIDGTGMLAGVPEQLREKVLTQIPMQRFGSVADVARAVEFLVHSDYITGTVLNVSGGYLT